MLVARPFSEFLQREYAVTRRVVLSACLISAASALALAAFAQAQSQEPELQLRGTQTSAAPGTAPRIDEEPPIRMRASPERTGGIGAAPLNLRAQTRGEIRPALGGNTSDRVQEPISLLPAAPLPLADPPPAIDEESLYSPLGLRLGRMTLFSTLNQSGGYDTNPGRVATDARSDLFSRTDGELRLQSDWSRHSMTVLLRGSYDAYRRDQDQSRPTLDASALLDLELRRGTRVALESGLALTSERPGSAELLGPVVGRPLVTDFYGAAALSHSINRLQFRLRGLAGRTQYQDAKLAGGGVLSQRDRDLTRLEASLRASFDIKPGLLPFFELAFDRRLYDRRVGADGLRRSSNGLTGRVGTTFELTRTLIGETSVGYQTRRYDDPLLRTFDGLIADASLEWSLSPVTTLRLTGTSSLNETTVAGSSGARARRIALGIRHDLRRQLTFNGSLAYEHTTYGGSNQNERTFIGSAGLAYSFNRNLAMTTDFRHERAWSSRIGGGYAANVYLVGLRLQH